MCCVREGQEGWWQGCVVNKQGQDIPFDWIKVDLDEHPLVAPVSATPGEPTKKARRGSTDKANEEEDEDECREDLAVIGEGAIVECWWDPTRQLDPWYYQHWYGADYEQKGYGTPQADLYAQLALGLPLVLMVVWFCVQAKAGGECIG